MIHTENGIKYFENRALRKKEIQKCRAIEKDLKKMEGEFKKLTEKQNKNPTGASTTIYGSSLEDAKKALENARHALEESQAVEIEVEERPSDQHRARVAMDNQLNAVLRELKTARSEIDEARRPPIDYSKLAKAESSKPKPASNLQKYFHFKSEKHDPKDPRLEGSRGGILAHVVDEKGFHYFLYEKDPVLHWIVNFDQLPPRTRLMRGDGISTNALIQRVATENKENNAFYPALENMLQNDYQWMTAQDFTGLFD